MNNKTIGYSLGVVSVILMLVAFVTFLVLITTSKPEKHSKTYEHDKASYGKKINIGLGVFFPSVLLALVFFINSDEYLNKKPDVQSKE